MKKENKTLWVTVEDLAVQYAKEANEVIRESIVNMIFKNMDKYMKTSINNAYTSARNYGLSIPKEDFESRFMQYLWEAIEAYEIGGSSFKNIVMRRFDFAEKHTWCQYKSKGDSNDKDGVSYDSARWDSLDRKAGGSESESEKSLADVVLGDTISAEDEYIEQNEEMRIIDDFAQVNERYANVIRFMALGYDGDALAMATGEAKSNNSKMRKLVQRSKESFHNFLLER